MLKCFLVGGARTSTLCREKKVLCSLFERRGGSGLIEVVGQLACMGIEPPCMNFLDGFGNPKMKALTPWGTMGGNGERFMAWSMSADI